MPPPLLKNQSYYDDSVCDLCNAIRLGPQKSLCVKQTVDRTRFWVDWTVWCVLTGTVSSEMKGRPSLLGDISPTGPSGTRGVLVIYLMYMHRDSHFFFSLMHPNVSDTLCLLQVINHLFYELQPRDFSKLLAQVKSWVTFLYCNLRPSFHRHPYSRD